MATASPGSTHGRATADQPTQAPSASRQPAAEPFLIKVQRAAGNMAANVLLQPPEADLVERAVRSPGVPLDAALRMRMEARLARRPQQPISHGGAGMGLSVVAPGHESERDADAAASELDRRPDAARVDLSGVRIHKGDLAEKSTRALAAKAFTVGSDIVVGQGQESTAADGGALLIHELTHTLQQRSGPRVVHRKPNDLAQAKPDANKEPDRSKIGFEAFSHREHKLSRRVVALSRAFRHLVDIAYPLLQSSGVLVQGRFDYQLYWHGILGVFALEDDIVDKDAYDPVHLSQWVQSMQGGLEDLRKLIAVIKPGGERADDAQRLEGQVAELEVQRQSLAAEKYIEGGFEARDKEAAAADLNRRMEEAHEYIDSKLDEIARDPRHADFLTRAYGQIIAQKLVDVWHLNGPQIRSLLERYRAEDRLNEVLMGGALVQTLLTRGVGGFWEYRAQGEGLLAGATRAELEGKVRHPIKERHFGGLEDLVVVGGFVAGLFQGIGDDLIDNIKMIAQLFTPSLWKQIYTFLTDELPHLAADEEYRFQVGAVLGRGELDEQRRVAGADPFEYGLTIGHASGVVLTEIVLLCIGIGWVLRAAKASPAIMKIVKPVMKVINVIAKTTAGKKVAQFATWAAEGLAGIERRFQRIRLKIPTFTEAGRAEKALNEAQLATERLKTLQVAARRAAMAGEEEQVAKYMEEFDKASQEVESKLAALEKQAEPAAGKAAVDPLNKPDVTPPAPKQEAVATAPKEEVPVTTSQEKPPATPAQAPAPQAPAPPAAARPADWSALESAADRPVPRQQTGGFRSQRARAGNREVVIIEGRVGEAIPQKKTLAKYTETLAGEHATHAGGMQLGENLPEAIASAPARELNLSALKTVENATRTAFERLKEVEGGAVELKTVVQIEHQVVAGEDIAVLVGVKREASVRLPGSDRLYPFIDFEATIDPVTRVVTIRPGNTLVRPIK